MFLEFELTRPETIMWPNLLRKPKQMTRPANPQLKRNWAKRLQTVTKLPSHTYRLTPCSGNSTQVAQFYIEELLKLIPKPNWTIDSIVSQ